MNKTYECWNCGKGNVTSKNLLEDNAIRSAVREFRILPQKPKREPFSGKAVEQAPSFSHLSSQHHEKELTRSKSTSTLDNLTDNEGVTDKKQWRNFKSQRVGRPRERRSREESSESDKSKDSDEENSYAGNFKAGK